MSVKLVIICGPSGIGKSKLEKVFRRWYPELATGFKKLVLFTGREPRSGEVEGKDYFFRSVAEIEAKREDKRFVVFNVRGNVQALDMVALNEDVDNHQVLFEGNTFVGQALMNSPLTKDLPKLSLFISPLSSDEINDIRAHEKNIDFSVYIKDMMRRKLQRRAEMFGKKSDPENIEIRASEAFTELRMAWKFDYIIPNHDGEDSENWEDFGFPIGDARETVKTFVQIIKDQNAPKSEKWSKTILK